MVQPGERIIWMQIRCMVTYKIRKLVYLPWEGRMCKQNVPT